MLCSPRELDKGNVAVAFSYAQTGNSVLCFYRIIVAGTPISELEFTQFFPFPSRTELLGCYSDEDFLAKLHCVRQAFQVRMAPGSWVSMAHGSMLLERAVLFPRFQHMKG